MSSAKKPNFTTLMLIVMGHIKLDDNMNFDIGNFDKKTIKEFKEI